ncbi:unnamed protein product, partial [Brassica oleracea var. botrytis]
AWTPRKTDLKATVFTGGVTRFYVLYTVVKYVVLAFLLFSHVTYLRCFSRSPKL